MGKSNRIRTNRAAEKIRTVGVRNKKKGMPSWAMTLITVVVAAALLLTVAGILLSANGVFTRLTTVVSSDNYKINANMMAYYYNTQYQNFLSNYSTYMSSGYFSLDTSKDLTKQPFGGAEGSETTYYDEMFLGEFEGTWHDYFMNAAVESAKSILIYCEAAPALDVALTDEDYATIDENMTSYETTATLYGYPTLNSFLAASFGQGVSESDVRDCMEYSLLASKAMEKLAEQIDESVTADDVNANYDANKLDYNVIDYTYYSFKVNYDEVAEEVLGKDYKESELKAKEAEVLAAYKAKIEAAKASAAELQGKTSIDDFKAYIYNYVANDSIDSTYSAQTIADDIKPSAEDIAHIKAEIVKDVVAEIIEGKEAADAAVEITDETGDTVEAYGKTVKKDYAKIVNTVKEKLFSSVLSAKTTYNVEKASYIKDNTFSDWAFKDERKANDIKLISEHDGSEEGKEITNDKGQSHTSVYFLTATQRKDTETSKNLSYMVFSSEDDAKAAIAELVAKGTLTQDAFLAETEVTKKATVSTSVTDYTEGSMGSTDFDKWLFDSERKVGDLTATPIKTTSDSTTVYIVALYEGEGQALWYLDVKSVIANERAEAKATELEELHKVTVKDSALKLVNVTA